MSTARNFSSSVLALAGYISSKLDPHETNVFKVVSPQNGKVLEVYRENFVIIAIGIPMPELAIQWTCKSWLTFSQRMPLRFVSTTKPSSKIDREDRINPQPVRQ
jgi:hypothetical protein